MKAKLLKFTNDCESYYRLAERYDSKGDLVKSIRALKFSLEVGFNPESLLKLGEIYYNNGIYDLAEQAFLELYAIDNYRTDALLGLYLVNLQQDNAYASQKYFSMLAEGGMNLTPEEIEDLLETARAKVEDTVRKSYKLVYPEPDSDKINRGNTLLASGDKDGALRVFSEIPESSECFSDAANNSALIHLMEGDSYTAVKEAMRALRKNGEDVYALSTLITAFHERGQHNMRDEFIDRLLSVQPSEEEKIIRIAFTMCQVKLHKLAVDYFSKVKERKNEKEILELYGVALYNSGNKGLARKLFQDSYTLYESPNALLYRELDAVGSELLPYYVEIPPTMIGRLANSMLADYAEMSFSDIVSGEDERERFKFALLYSNDNKLFTALAKKMMASKKGRNYLERYVMRKDAYIAYKCIVLTLFRQKGYLVNFAGVYFPAKLTRIPAELRNFGNILAGYSLADAFVACLTPELRLECVESAVKIAENLSGYGKLGSKNALAYLILQNMEERPFLSDNFLNFFSVNMKTVDKYRAMLCNNANEEDV